MMLLNLDVQSGVPTSGLSYRSTSDGIYFRSANVSELTTSAALYDESFRLRYDLWTTVVITTAAALLAVATSGGNLLVIAAFRVCLLYTSDAADE